MTTPTPTITYDDDRQAWEATLPPGYRFASGPHSLVEPATQTEATAPTAWKREAKATMAGRLASDRVMACDCRDCR